MGCSSRVGSPGTRSGLACRRRVRKPGGVLNRKVLGLGPCRGKALGVERRARAEAVKFRAFLEPRKGRVGGERSEGGDRNVGGG